MIAWRKKWKTDRNMKGFIGAGMDSKAGGSFVFFWVTGMPHLILSENGAPILDAGRTAFLSGRRI
jgi:hypothetical protein